MEHIISQSSLETQEIAKNIAQEILANKRANLVLLEGELGGGKTTFSQGFMAGLGIIENITSPTFVIMKSYSIPNSEYKIYHLDLYRLNQEWEVLDLGIMDLIQNQKNMNPFGSGLLEGMNRGFERISLTNKDIIV